MKRTVKQLGPKVISRWKGKRRQYHLFWDIHSYVVRLQFIVNIWYCVNINLFFHAIRILIFTKNVPMLSTTMTRSKLKSNFSKNIYVKQIWIILFFVWIIYITILSSDIILNDIVFYASTGRLMSTGGRLGDIFSGAREWQTRAAGGVTGCSKCVRNTRPRISSGRRFHRAIFPELPSIYRELCPSGN